MTRWSVRIIGVILLLMFVFLFLNLKKQLMTRQPNPPAAPAQSR